MMQIKMFLFMVLMALTYLLVTVVVLPLIIITSVATWLQGKLTLLLVKVQFYLTVRMEEIKNGGNNLAENPFVAGEKKDENV